MKFLFSLLLILLPLSLRANCTLAITVNDAISASTSDYFMRAQKQAQQQDCHSIFLRLNTPGGDLQSTHLIVEQILASQIPYLCLISPQGARAGSAGAIILQACHFNGGLESTNLGASTPILGNGSQLSDDLRKKIINDTVSWLKAMTELRGRNLEFSRKIITEAQSLSSKEAVNRKALDVLAKDESDFLQKANERKFASAKLVEFPPDLRYKILNFVADPEFAYILFMGSLGLLYLEMTHPGLIAPGVLGGLGLVLSLVALHKLDVSWGGIALILLGLVFLVAELFFTSYGVLGIGGLVAIFIGSNFLFDPSSGHVLPYSLTLPVVLGLGLVFLGVGFLALKTLRLKKSDHDTDLLKHLGKVSVLAPDGRSGQIQIMGEFWKFISDEQLNPGDSVKVISREGLTLKVQKGEASWNS